MPKIQESQGRYFITIPKDLITLYGLKKGDNMAFIEERPGVITIQKSRV